MSTIFKTSLRTFNRNERGNVGITFGLMLIPICGVMGLAVDYAQAVKAQTRMQASADAAALAAINARSATEAERITLAVATFKSNYNPGHPDQAPTPAVTISGAAVSVTSSTGVPTTFSALYGVEQLVVEAQSAAELVNTGKKLEVGLMVDLTGSMGATRNGETKITSLRTASVDLLDILLPASGANDGLVKIGVAPFADYVNAGQYASEATGLPASGTYNNLSNLTSTRNGAFTGTYAAGTIGNQAGSQSGATPPATGASSGGSGSTSAAGATYTSGHCTVSTATVTTTTGGGTATFVSMGNNNGNWPVGKKLDVEGWTFPPNVIVWANNWAKIKKIEKYKNNQFQATSAENDGWWLKVPTSTAGLTWRTDGSNKIGLQVELDGTNTAWEPGLIEATAANPIRKIKKWKNGAWEYDGSAKTSGRFILVPVSWTTAGTTVSTTTTLPQCTTTAQPTGALITCVTERSGSEAYTDESPAGSAVVGAYNHGVTSKSNYSADGKCYTAGRELPKVIAMTSDRETLEDFFTNATIGGATPGHLGTAWAWYLVSPLWNSVFGTEAAEYEDSGTTKAVILMTDGEYNIHYTTPAAKDQALALCTSMKAKGIKVYTIGFGFSTSSTATDNTTEGRAKDLMQQCASPAADGESNNYYFPYDGDALRETFSQIGSSLIDSSQAGNVVRLTQ